MLRRSPIIINWNLFDVHIPHLPPHKLQRLAEYVYHSNKCWTSILQLFRDVRTCTCQITDDVMHRSRWEEFRFPLNISSVCVCIFSNNITRSPAYAHTHTHPVRLAVRVPVCRYASMNVCVCVCVCVCVHVYYLYSSCSHESVV